eukprot:GHVH01001949.1.p1 GENE.GHVH01001949.1~~GHVH01001949.1.p1  ORF type:complete len:318 (+),score=59.95 GHVH01001949.1:86-1039(+)
MRALRNLFIVAALSFLSEAQFLKKQSVQDVAQSHLRGDKVKSSLSDLWATVKSSLPVAVPRRQLMGSKPRPVPHENPQAEASQEGARRAHSASQKKVSKEQQQVRQEQQEIRIDSAEHTRGDSNVRRKRNSKRHKDTSPVIEEELLARQEEEVRAPVEARKTKHKKHSKGDEAVIEEELLARQEEEVRAPVEAIKTKHKKHSKGDEAVKESAEEDLSISKAEAEAERKIDRAERRYNKKEVAEEEKSPQVQERIDDHRMKDYTGTMLMPETFFSPRTNENVKKNIEMMDVWTQHRISGKPIDFAKAAGNEVMVPKKN